MLKHQKPSHGGFPMAPKFFKSFAEDSLREKELAQESTKTERDRKKIAKMIQEIDELHTQENLEKAKEQNRERLYRQSDRVRIDSTTGLFDANQNPEEMSSRVKKMAETIKEYLDPSLEG